MDLKAKPKGAGVSFGGKSGLLYPMPMESLNLEHRPQPPPPRLVYESGIL